MIEGFRLQPKQVRNPTDKMIEQLKSQMDEIDVALCEFKRANFDVYESLVHDEKVLTREVEVYDAKIANWAKNPGGSNSDRPNVSLLSEKLSQSERLKEVIEFDVNLDLYYK